MERNNERKRVALVLSSTESDTFAQYRLAELSGYLAPGAGRARRCYLCGRAEGEDRVSLQNDPNAPVLLTTIRLSRYRVDLLERFALDYLLCFECAALLQVFGSYAKPEASLS